MGSVKPAGLAELNKSLEGRERFASLKVSGIDFAVGHVLISGVVKTLATLE